MNYNKTGILIICAVVGGACVICAIAAAAGREPATHALEIAASNAQTDAADAQAAADAARADADRARAELVTAQSYADALHGLLDTVRGTLTWLALSSTVSPLVYIACGVVLCSPGVFFAGAYWGAERERKRGTARVVLARRSHDDAGGAS
jgi:hypothetical protein